jgi:hypothetical protein
MWEGSPGIKRLRRARTTNLSRVRPRRSLWNPVVRLRRQWARSNRNHSAALGAVSPGARIIARIERGVCMGRLLAFVVILAIVIGVVGWNRGWLQFSKTDAGEKTNVSMSVDKEKLHEDVNKVKEGVGKVGSEVKDKVASQPSDKNQPSDK